MNVRLAMSSQVRTRENPRASKKCADLVRRSVRCVWCADRLHHRERVLPPPTWLMPAPPAPPARSPLADETLQNVPFAVARARTNRMPIPAVSIAAAVPLVPTACASRSSARPEGSAVNPGMLVRVRISWCEHPVYLPQCAEALEPLLVVALRVDLLETGGKHGMLVAVCGGGVVRADAARNIHVTDPE
ncbi:hypothetical protein CYMTET_15831 [Cymbomonas tetramitiformis]|uniref:Uncharacterized protein n=1 Tax=Cymbomonas tetramitiformis TaxID=36881 RepID=A0AAE0L8I9_9CHLO|nr:hypothetical protein CYMTET_15831 [Cymbomonas tetramitiformis]